MFTVDTSRIATTISYCGDRADEIDAELLGSRLVR
jgi:hypothetical protein